MSKCAECGLVHEPGENTMCNADGGMAERIFELETENARLRDWLAQWRREAIERGYPMNLEIAEEKP